MFNHTYIQRLYSSSPRQKELGEFCKYCGIDRKYELYYSGCNGELLKGNNYVMPTTQIHCVICGNIITDYMMNKYPNMCKPVCSEHKKPKESVSDMFSCEALGEELKQEMIDSRRSVVFYHATKCLSCNTILDKLEDHELTKIMAHSVESVVENTRPAPFTMSEYDELLVNRFIDKLISNLKKVGLV